MVGVGVVEIDLSVEIPIQRIRFIAPLSAYEAPTWDLII